MSDSPTTAGANSAPPQAAAAPKNRARPVLLGLLAVGAIAGGLVYAEGRGKETTDDAQVEGHVVNVAPRISGRVGKVLVKDNQPVKAGQPLVEIEDDDYLVKIEAAEADLAQAEANAAVARANLALVEKNATATVVQAKGGVREASGALASNAANLESVRADIAAAESRRKLAETELGRVRDLVKSGAATQADLDVRQATFDQSVATLEAARARLAVANASTAASAGGVEVAKGRLESADTGPQQIEVARANLGVAEARVKQAKAALRLAKLNEEWTKIVAPVDGVVSRRTVELGQIVDPSRPLLALVPDNDVWIVANYKEDQLAHMKAGQAVDVKIDTYGGRTFKGHVDSLAGASGARFALLPPDNASGNFVKVVQRIPVLIRFDGTSDVPLRPGMSAVVSVHVEK
jgi:membrane fusion protein (multidrug efflux system)